MFAIIWKHKTPNPLAMAIIYMDCCCVPQEIANTLNKYFIDVGPNLASKISQSIKSFNPLTPGKLRKNGTFKQQMAFFGPV